MLVAPLLSALGFYAEGPPPGHTGGFGEPTCAQCHFGAELNTPPGKLELSGLPDAYAPGETYRLTVELRHPEARRAGFQIAVRYLEGAQQGSQAGKLVSLDSRVQVVVDSNGVAYAEHTQSGSSLTEAGVARWVLTWRAPEAPGGPVVFHAAANAANDDASEFGDLIYTAAVSIPPK
ncbi:MAG: hypothetical protein KatS3mg081_2080 [Gemmatimonadales bacterium]|nr:MAG: hypothetical protein KatS3mg081_2080 [Gemmatimonadales bacterium]